jgi:hypothetical protein
MEYVGGLKKSEKTMPLEFVALVAGEGERIVDWFTLR